MHPLPLFVPHYLCIPNPPEVRNPAKAPPSAEQTANPSRARGVIALPVTGALVQRFLLVVVILIPSAGGRGSGVVTLLIIDRPERLPRRLCIATGRASKRG